MLDDCIVLETSRAHLDDYYHEKCKDEYYHEKFGLSPGNRIQLCRLLGGDQNPLNGQRGEVVKCVNPEKKEYLVRLDGHLSMYVLHLKNLTYLNPNDDPRAQRRRLMDRLVKSTARGVSC